jgi:hypothetical protein
MEVQLKACEGKNLATGRVESHEQYRVIVDGTLVGYKSWNFGSAICFIGRVSPTDKEQIESEVDLILGDGAKGVMPPEVPEEKEETEEIIDDLNP